MRQAVVVIHGIGEQRPMDTMRGFVDAVMPLPEDIKKPKFWNKPDPFSELFELRKLTTPQSKTMPPTDFFEYYWAYQAEGTKIVHVLSWAWRLLLRWPGNVPKHLKALWWTLWGLVTATAVLLSSGYWGQVVELQKSTVTTNRLLSGLSSLLVLAISGFIVNYVGDAARYLNPSPANIDMRRRIRTEGVQLLRDLHKSNYDRIVVVGHSLGSVIAYDILRNLWTEYNTRQSGPAMFGQDALHAMDKTGQDLAADPNGPAAGNFRKDQAALWQEERAEGNAWRVTDLITIGSPLAHAELLLARTKKELRERQEERELPKCPPVADENSYAYSIVQDADSEKEKIYVLHHAAAFACTRWTNLYFPAKMGFFGDLVGGPLREIFGPGIQDVAVCSAEWGGLLQHTPLIHTHYWSQKTVPSPKPESNTPWALEQVIKALDLQSRAWLKLVPIARAVGWGSSAD